jgi:serine/threonine protein kinase
MQYMVDVAEGMSYLHANRILHGDLKVRAVQCS